MYENFAFYYDQMMDIDYDFFVDLVNKYIEKKGVILDAGCGTASIMVPLLKEGFNVMGVDNSSEMLEIARSKLESSGLAAHLYENDLQKPFSLNTFQAVYSFLDVINYLADYKIAFKNIYESLVSGGVFLFDVHQVGYLNSLIGYVEEEDYEDFSYQWQVLKAEEENSIYHDLKIMVSDKVFHERHYQRTYSIEEYVQSLEEIGFKVKVLPETDEIKVFILATK